MAKVFPTRRSSRFCARPQALPRRRGLRAGGRGVLRLSPSRRCSSRFVIVPARKRTAEARSRTYEISRPCRPGRGPGRWGTSTVTRGPDDAVQVHRARAYPGRCRHPRLRRLPRREPVGALFRGSPETIPKSSPEARGVGSRSSRLCRLGDRRTRSAPRGNPRARPAPPASHRRRSGGALDFELDRLYTSTI